jgi:hypothetical protein
MKKIVLAAATVLSLSTSVAAFAQPGAAWASHPGYWTNTSADQRTYPQTRLLGQGTVLATIFGHSNSDNAVANKPTATPGNGGIDRTLH